MAGENDEENVGEGERERRGEARRGLVAGFQGERVRLVPLDEALHLENALRWMNDPEVTRFLLRTDGASRLQEKDWFERVSRGDGDRVWAVHDEDGRHIGFTGVHAIDWRHRSAKTGTVIGERSAWGKGYGTDAMRVRVRVAFAVLNLHRLESEALVENVASQRALERAGYRREGVARQRVWSEGRWHDTVLYGLLADEWLAARPA